MADLLARAMSDDGSVRGFAVVTTGLVEEARCRHGTLPTATAALGRALTSALLLGGMLKDGEKISLEFSGDGPLGTILVDATPDGATRGFVARPATHLPPRAGKLDVGGAVGKGTLCVMRTQVATAQFYRSVVPLVSGEIGVDVASYLVQSEQTPSVVAAGVYVEPDGHVGAAGGYLIQALPDAPVGTIDRLEANIAGDGRPSDLVRAGVDAAGMLMKVLAGVPVHVLAELPVGFRCRCSHERVAAAMVAMGRAELEDVLAGERHAEVVCEFCATRYVVEEAELRACLASMAQ